MIPVEDQTVVIYAAKDKHSAMKMTDETGTNMFTKYLLKYLAEENLSLLSMFNKIQKDVMQETRKKQSPMIIPESGSTSTLVLNMKPSRFTRRFSSKELID